MKTVYTDEIEALEEEIGIYNDKISYFENFGGESVRRVREIKEAKEKCEEKLNSLKRSDEIEWRFKYE